MIDSTLVARRQKRRRVPKYTVLRCRAGGRHQVGWCLALCTPTNGRGVCGRQAPHAVTGRSLVAMRISEAARTKQAS